MRKETDFSRKAWTFIFICESALVIGLLILIVLFSVPTERRLMDTVRELFHAKEVKYDQYSKQQNVFTLMNLDERRKGNNDLKDELLGNVEMRFLYKNGGDNWGLTVSSLHFASHNQAREYFNRYETAMTTVSDSFTPLDWHEYADSRVKELGCHLDPAFYGSEKYECYIMFLESKSVVCIKFYAYPDVNEEQKKILTDLCYELSLPNPFELEDTMSERQN
ncbi:MAG: hypothetical protein J5752_02345 [Clostridiales bacterium]|nr:hypothetical protein [Clostridiales bacterium]